MREAGRATFLTAAGRLRLGWRLFLFVAALVTLYLALSSLLPTNLTGHAVALLAASLVSGWMLLASDGKRAGALGFGLWRGSGSEALRGLALGVLVALAAVAAIAAVGGVRWSSTPGGAGAFVVGALLTLGVLAIPAAAEEALLRGYPLQALSESWGALPALLVTSTGFGLLHSGNPGVSGAGILNTGLAGVFLGALYLRTGSLWWPTGAHLGWNWTHGFLLDLPVSGLDLADTPGMDSLAVGPDFISGGAFGPEGSLVTAVVLVCASVWVWNTRRLEPSPSALEAPPMGRLRILGQGV